jgi:hypothetical protein
MFVCHRRTSDEKIRRNVMGTHDTAVSSPDLVAAPNSAGAADGEIDLDLDRLSAPTAGGRILAWTPALFVGLASSYSLLRDGVDPSELAVYTLY